MSAKKRANGKTQQTHEREAGGAAETPQDEQAERSEANAKAAAEEAARAAEEAAGEAAGDATEDDEVSRLQAEVDDLKDQLLRALAETENVRRRAERERQDAVKYATAPLARDLLGVADNLRRALESAPPREEVQDVALKTLLDGIDMTERELHEVLQRHKIEPIEPQGEKFDPHHHEAMYEVPESGQPAGTVVQVLQTGYKLHDRLLRPARVGVAKAGEGERGPGSTEKGSNVDTQA